MSSLSGSLLIYGILLLILLVFLASSLKIAAESERFAVFTMGRYAGLKGPGVVFAPGQVSRLIRISVGDIGTMAGPGLATFHGVSIPVDPSGSLRTGDAVRIDAFADDSITLAKADGAATTTCPKCGHAF